MMHGLTQCVSVICGIVGIVAIVKAKNDGDYPDLLSVHSHSWLGVTSAILFLLQVKENTTVYVFTAVLEQQHCVLQGPRSQGEMSKVDQTTSTRLPILETNLESNSTSPSQHLTN